jgi:hypothetical protein
MQYKQPERVKFIIIHDYTETPGECMPGEEVIAIILIYRGKRYWIPWSPTHLILVDYLCRHRWISQDAWRIAAQLQLDPFVVQHGTNAPGHNVRLARTSRTAVRKQVERIRAVLQKLIDDEGLNLRATDIIRSEESSTRAVRYRIWADVSYEHWPLQDGEGPVDGLPLGEIPPTLLGGGRGGQLGVHV